MQVLLTLDVATGYRNPSASPARRTGLTHCFIFFYESAVFMCTSERRLLNLQWVTRSVTGHVCIRHYQERFFSGWQKFHWYHYCQCFDRTAAKVKCRIRATRLASSDLSFNSLDFTRTCETCPDGRMVISSTILPCKPGFDRRARR